MIFFWTYKKISSKLIKRSSRDERQSFSTISHYENANSINLLVLLYNFELLKLRQMIATNICENTNMRKPAVLSDFENRKRGQVPTPHLPIA